MAELTAFEAECAALRRQGLSAGDIAAKVGRTRNAVCGALFRARAKGSDMTAEPAEDLDAVGAPEPALAPVTITAPSAAPAASPEPKPPARPAVAPRDKTLPLGAGEAVLALRSIHCRWPIGDPVDPSFRFCCARVVAPGTTGAKGGYCAAHCTEAVSRVVAAPRMPVRTKEPA